MLSDRGTRSRLIARMKRLTSSDLPLASPVSATLGFFDGIHRGHTALLRQLRQRPEPSLVYSFDRKPNVPKPLFSPEERAAIMECAGIDYYYAAIFDEQFKDQSPRAFLRRLTKDFNIKSIVVGSDFRFGSDAAGDVQFLAEQAPKLGYKLEIVKTRGDGEDKFSSSELRSLVREGRIAEADALMGRRYFVDGIVEQGARRGSRFGFPTANIRSSKLLPAHGVYATLTRTPEGVFPSVTNVGQRPTVDDNGFENVETHILDKTLDLYGKPIRVYFIRRLRPEIKFADTTQLREQIAADAREAKRILSEPDVYTTYELC